jgi:hypothetical protein
MLLGGVGAGALCFLIAARLLKLVIKSNLGGPLILIAISQFVQCLSGQHTPFDENNSEYLRFSFFCKWLIVGEWKFSPPIDCGE